MTTWEDADERAEAIAAMKRRDQHNAKHERHKALAVFWGAVGVGLGLTALALFLALCKYGARYSC